MNYPINSFVLNVYVGEKLESLCLMVHLGMDSIQTGFVFLKCVLLATAVGV